MKLRLPGRAGRPDPGLDWGDEAADEPVVSLLDGFVAGPMSPDRETLDRMGKHLRAAFVQEAAERRVAANVPATLSAARRPSRRTRFAAVAVSISLLTVAGTGVAAAESGAGQPFYRARLTIEALFLPPAGTDGRLAADLDRAQARLGDAQSAAATGNWNAEADAMGAYADVVGSIAIPTGSTAGAQARRRLANQLVILEQLRNGTGDGSGSQIRRAIDDVDSILAGGSTQPGNTAAPSPNGPAASPAGSGRLGPNSSQGAGAGSSAGPGSGSSAAPGSGRGPNESPSPNSGQGGGSGSGGGAMPTPAPGGRPSTGGSGG